MGPENPLVVLVRSREGLSQNLAVIRATDLRRDFDRSFRIMQELAEEALGELDKGFTSEGVAMRLSQKLLADGKTEFATPFTSTVTDLVMECRPLLMRIMGVLNVETVNPDELRKLLNDLIAMAKSSDN